MLYPLGKKLRKTFGRMASTISVTHGNKCHTWPFLVCFYSICFFIYGIQHIYQSYGALILCFQELCCLDFMILVLITTFGIPHSGIMLPRFYVPFSFYRMCILNYGIMLPRFHDSSFIYDICILHFGIMLPRFHVSSFIYRI